MESKIDISANVRNATIEILNARLAEAIDLSAQAKQAHWNVKGPSFIALHELFDQVYTGLVDHVDLIAERVTALGGVAEGTLAVAAARSSLPSYPLEARSGEAHVDALSSSLAAFGARVRQAIEQITELGDVGTADLFTEVSRGLGQASLVPGGASGLKPLGFRSRKPIPARVFEQLWRGLWPPLFFECPSRLTPPEIGDYHHTPVAPNPSGTKPQWHQSPVAPKPSVTKP